MILFMMVLVFFGTLIGGVIGGQSGNFVAGIVSGQIIANLVVLATAIMYKPGS